jgi:NADH dehydrogenase
MILVAGATGVLGGMITRQLLEAGEEVRILVRKDSPSEEMARQGLATSAGSLVEAGAQPTCGDIKDWVSLDQACVRVETVITTANSAMRGGEDNVDTVDREGNRNLIDAAKAAGVNQFIFTSVLGADVNNPLPFIQAKAETQAYLREGGIPYTILAPNFFMESWVGMVVGIPLGAGQPVTLVGEGRRQHSFVSAVDVAAFATAAVGHPAAMNQHIVIGGPEPLSWCDVVVTFERVLGQEIPVRFVSPGEPVPGAPEIVTTMLPALETFDSVVPMTETASAFGVELTPLETYARRTLAVSAS